MRNGWLLEPTIITGAVNSMIRFVVRIRIVRISIKSVHKLAFPRILAIISFICPADILKTIILIIEIFESIVLIVVTIVFIIAIAVIIIGVIPSSASSVEIMPSMCILDHVIQLRAA